MKATEVTRMKSDGPLIFAVLFLASGLTIIFAYGVGSTGFNAAYPFSAANLNLSIATTGPAAMGGLALTALGLLVLLWALICALVGEFSGMGASWKGTGRRERKRLEQEQNLEGRERERLEQQERLLKQEERLRAAYPRD
jgi:signal transduction histidine kinase